MNWLEAYNDLAGEAAVIVTQVRVKGSAPAEVGAKMIVDTNGLRWGSVGGGKIEAQAIETAKEILQQQKLAQSKVWNLQTDIGMSCGGEVTMFFEPTQRFTWQVAIFGAGHVSQELCRVMSTWDCKIQVFDSRREWLSRLPKSGNIFPRLSDDLSQNVKNLLPNSLVLSITKGHTTDLPILREALSNNYSFPFIGVIGSSVKGGKLRQELRAQGLSDLQIERLTCPLGLPLGNNSPPEIAISIAAQLLQIKCDLKENKNDQHPRP